MRGMPPNTFPAGRRKARRINNLKNAIERLELAQAYAEDGACGTAADLATEAAEILRTLQARRQAMIAEAQARPQSPIPPQLRNSRFIKRRSVE